MHNVSYTKGFTLVETLVAISILVVVIVGPMTIAQKGVQNAYFANNQVTAVFLAQEAIEGIRELRDEAALKAYQNGTLDTDTWLTLLNCNGPYGCKFLRENTSNPYIKCDVLDDCKLFVDSNGVYSHTTGSPSLFTRTVTIGTAVGGGVPVEVSVTWKSKNINREVKLQTWIYDHYQRYGN
ncbi:prepilin-type N-terminal cleavage/methylation domain-containing protein [Candidatus Kaiserbacteria bacterium]|nr:MAG: prepilin-type N-terminal cleavage/methylation domain-containing protein [Candidatus Kaiserbacteria bacterium]